MLFLLLIDVIFVNQDLWTYLGFLDILKFLDGNKGDTSLMTT